MCPPKQKKCTLCLVVKPATEFNKDNNCSDGLKVSALSPAGRQWDFGELRHYALHYDTGIDQSQSQSQGLGQGQGTIHNALFTARCSCARCRGLGFWAPSACILHMGFGD